MPIKMESTESPNTKTTQVQQKPIHHEEANQYDATLHRAASGLRWDMRTVLSTPPDSDAVYQAVHRKSLPSSKAEIRRIKTDAPNPKSILSTPPTRSLNHGAYQAVQRKVSLQTQQSPTEVHHIAAQGVRGMGEQLPHFNRVQQAFAPHDVSHIRAYTGPTASKACEGIGAEAYTTGNKIAFNSTHPSFHTTIHETVHAAVHQQPGNSPQLKDGVGTVGDKYERQADTVADNAVEGKSITGLLNSIMDSSVGPTPKTSVQKKISVTNRITVPFLTEEKSREEHETIIQSELNSTSEVCRFLREHIEIPAFIFDRIDEVVPILKEMVDDDEYWEFEYNKKGAGQLLEIIKDELGEESKSEGEEEPPRKKRRVGEREQTDFRNKELPREEQEYDRRRMRLATFNMQGGNGEKPTFLNSLMNGGKDKATDAICAQEYGTLEVRRGEEYELLSDTIQLGGSPWRNIRPGADRCPYDRPLHRDLTLNYNARNHQYISHYYWAPALAEKGARNPRSSFAIVTHRRPVRVVTRTPTDYRNRDDRPVLMVELAAEKGHPAILIASCHARGASGKNAAAMVKEVIAESKRRGIRCIIGADFNRDPSLFKKDLAELLGYRKQQRSSPEHGKFLEKKDIFVYNTKKSTHGPKRILDFFVDIGSGKKDDPSTQGPFLTASDHNVVIIDIDPAQSSYESSGDESSGGKVKARKYPTFDMDISTEKIGESSPGLRLPDEIISRGVVHGETIRLNFSDNHSQLFLVIEGSGKVEASGLNPYGKIMYGRPIMEGG